MIGSDQDRNKPGLVYSVAKVGKTALNICVTIMPVTNMATPAKRPGTNIFLIFSPPLETINECNEFSVS